MYALPCAACSVVPGFVTQRGLIEFGAQVLPEGQKGVHVGGEALVVVTFE